MEAHVEAHVEAHEKAHALAQAVAQVVAQVEANVEMGDQCLLTIGVRLSGSTPSLKLDQILLLVFDLCFGCMGMSCLGCMVWQQEYQVD